MRTLTPSIGVRYLYGSFGGYTETGSTANLTVNSQTVGTLEERAELKLTRATSFNATTALLRDITGGALGTQRVGSNTVNAALLGQSIPFRLRRISLAVGFQHRHQRQGRRPRRVLGRTQLRR